MLCATCRQNICVLCRMASSLPRRVIVLTSQIKNKRLNLSRKGAENWPMCSRRQDKTATSQDKEKGKGKGSDNERQNSDQTLQNRQHSARTRQTTTRRDSDKTATRIDKTRRDNTTPGIQNDAFVGLEGRTLPTRYALVNETSAITPLKS